MREYFVLKAVAVFRLILGLRNFIFTDDRILIGGGAKIVSQKVLEMKIRTKAYFSV